MGDSKGPLYKLRRGSVEVTPAVDREMIKSSFRGSLVYFVNYERSTLAQFLKFNRPNTTVCFDGSDEPAKIGPHPDFYAKDPQGYKKAVGEWIVEAEALEKEIGERARNPDDEQVARLCDLLCDLLWINNIVVTSTSYYGVRLEGEASRAS